MRYAISAVTAVLCSLLVLAPLTGCFKPSQSQIATLTKTLGDASASIAAIQGNPQLAQQLTQDTNAAVAAIQNWKKGDVTNSVIQALGIVQADLSLIPGTSQYAPLIDIAIGTVQTILTLLPAATVAPGTVKVATLHPARHVYLAKPPQNADQFRQQWNNTAVAYGLTNAFIQ